MLRLVSPAFPACQMKPYEHISILLTWEGNWTQANACGAATRAGKHLFPGMFLLQALGLRIFLWSPFVNSCGKDNLRSHSSLLVSHESNVDNCKSWLLSKKHHCFEVAVRFYLDSWGDNFSIYSKCEKTTQDIQPNPVGKDTKLIQYLFIDMMPVKSHRGRRYPGCHATQSRNSM